MSLSTLIKKGGLLGIVTATSATTATQETDKLSIVASVATVAVAPRLKPLPELSPDSELSVRAWLAHIEETDPAVITEVLNRCRNDLNARRYFMERSEEVPKPTTVDLCVTCGACVHFERINHPSLGHCSQGEPEAIVGLWDTDHRYCERFATRQGKPQ